MSIAKQIMSSAPVKALLSTGARRKLFASYGDLVSRKTLYHATPTSRMKGINRLGLRENAKKNWRVSGHKAGLFLSSKTPGVFLGNLPTVAKMRLGGSVVNGIDRGDIVKELLTPHTLLKVRVKRSRLLHDPDAISGISSKLLGFSRIRGRIGKAHIKETTFGRELGGRLGERIEGAVTSKLKGLRDRDVRKFMRSAGKWVRGARKAVKKRVGI